MTDRKHYSKRREENLYRIVNDALIDIRMSILRGEYQGISEKAKEYKFAKDTITLGDKVCAEYRKSYAVNKK